MANDTPSFPLNRPCHFEIHSTNPEKTIEFVQRVFGWSVHKYGGQVEGGANEYWLIGTDGARTPEPSNKPGINGGLMRSRDGMDRTVNTIQVDNVDRVTAEVIAAGGSVVVPKMAIPGVGYLAYCNDPAGHLFGVMHQDMSAK